MKLQRSLVLYAVLFGFSYSIVLIVLYSIVLKIHKNEYFGGLPIPMVGSDTVFLYNETHNGLADCLFSTANLTVYGRLTGAPVVNAWLSDWHGQYDTRLWTMDAVIADSKSDVPSTAKFVDSFRDYRIQKIMQETGLSFEKVSKEYISILRSFRPLPDLESTLPAGLHDYIGIHVRKSDKIVTNPGQEEMSLDQFNRIFDKLCSYIRAIVLVHGERKFYICSEEKSIVDQLKEFITPLHSEIKILTSASEIDYSQYKNYHALADFFCLSRCKCILLGASWSGFSFIAALIGDIPMIAFAPKTISETTTLELVNIIRLE